MALSKAVLSERVTQSKISQLNEITIDDMVTWARDFYDDDWHLKSVRGFEGLHGCGLWKALSKEEIHYINNTKPARNKMPGNGGNASTLIDFVNQKELITTMQYFIRGDCWSVFSTENDRTPRTIYYNLHEIFDEMEEEKSNELEEKYQKIRGELIENPRRLIKELKAGKTIHLYLGQELFKDVIYKKISGENNMYVKTEIIYYQY